MTLRLRPARPLDAGALGEILHRFQQDTPWMPKLWSGAETLAFCGEMIERGWVSVAKSEGRVLGFLARDGAEICALYVADDARGRGVGASLIDLAQSEGGPLVLRVLACNAPARRFYARAGFRECASPADAANDENLPELTCRWQREVA